jgi:hypothetical protein
MEYFLQVQVEATNFFGTSELSEIFEFLTEERSNKYLTFYYISNSHTQFLNYISIYSEMLA